MNAILVSLRTLERSSEPQQHFSARVRYRFSGVEKIVGQRALNKIWICTRLRAYLIYH